MRSSVFGTMSLLRRRRRRLRALVDEAVVAAGLRAADAALPVTLNRFAAVLFVFIFGMGGPRVMPGKLGKVKVIR